jgi:hypothetical protein
MLDLFRLIFAIVNGLLRSRVALEAEILVVFTDNLSSGVVVVKSAKNGV